MNNKCLICNTEYQQADLQFCPVCCWEIVSIPVDSSDRLKQWFEKKKKAFENAFNSLKDDEKTIVEKSEATAKIEEDKKGLFVEIKEIKNKIDELQIKIDEYNELIVIDKDRFNQLDRLKMNFPNINNEIEKIKQSIPKGINNEEIIVFKELNRIFSQY